MAEQQEIVTFEGILDAIQVTKKVVKFRCAERYFIGWETNRAVTLLSGYLENYNSEQIKIELPIPAKKSIDKQNNNIEQFVLTNHTRIYMNGSLIFCPALQQDDLLIIDNAVKEAEDEQLKYDAIQKEKALANQQALPKQLHRASDLIDKRVIKQGRFYKVQGKEIPDAVTIEKEVNNLIEKSGRVLNLDLLIQDKNDEKAWAKVRVTDVLTGQYKEAGVIHHYNTLADKYLLDLLVAYEEQKRDKYTKQLICPENPILSIENNNPVLTPFAQRAITIRLLTFKQFAERDAATKAASIAYLKMLNREWRSAEEISSEADEVEFVNNQN